MAQPIHPQHPLLIFFVLLPRSQEPTLHPADDPVALDGQLPLDPVDVLPGARQLLLLGQICQDLLEVGVVLSNLEVAVRLAQVLFGR